MTLSSRPARSRARDSESMGDGAQRPAWRRSPKSVSIEPAVRRTFVPEHPRTSRHAQNADGPLRPVAPDEVHTARRGGAVRIEREDRGAAQGQGIGRRGPGCKSNGSSREQVRITTGASTTRSMRWSMSRVRMPSPLPSSTTESHLPRSPSPKNKPTVVDRRRLVSAREPFARRGTGQPQPRAIGRRPPERSVC